MEKSLGKASSKFGRDASQVERVKTRKGNSKQKAPAHFTQEAVLAAIVESNSDHRLHGASAKLCRMCLGDFCVQPRKKTTAHKAGCQMEKSLGKASSKFGRDASQVERVKTRKGNSKQKAPAHFTQEAVLAAIVESNSEPQTPWSERQIMQDVSWRFLRAAAKKTTAHKAGCQMEKSLGKASSKFGRDASQTPWSERQIMQDVSWRFLRAAAKKTTAHKAGCQMEKSLGKASSKFGRDASQVERVKTRKGNSKQKAPAHFTQEADSMERAPNYAGCVLEIFACSREKNYSTLYSRVVSHRSTDNAITSLTSEIGRDPVLFDVRLPVSLVLAAMRHLKNGEKSGQGFFKVWKRCEPGRAREN
ncbi:hypothetical protein BDR26DRAFT_903554 [Obelidium mucronatum]|nr:hypothetical protein BDR26DRAFT_903554 [Obelidium mucronatum]